VPARGRSSFAPLPSDLSWPEPASAVAAPGEATLGRMLAGALDSGARPDGLIPFPLPLPLTTLSHFRFSFALFAFALHRSEPAPRSTFRSSTLATILVNGDGGRRGSCGRDAHSIPRCRRHDGRYPSPVAPRAEAIARRLIPSRRSLPASAAIRWNPNASRVNTANSSSTSPTVRTGRNRVHNGFR
jgi:hypothetical protein